MEKFTCHTALISYPQQTAFSEANSNLNHDKIALSWRTVMKSSSCAPFSAEK